MLEAEIQKLTRAVEALTVKLDSFVIRVQSNPATAPAPEPAPASAPAPAPASEPVHEPVKTPKASKKASEAPAPIDPHPSTSKENLKDLALQISRADTSAKEEIVSILASHNAKTITALPDDQDVLFDVYTRLMNIATKIATDGE